MEYTYNFKYGICFKFDSRYTWPRQSSKGTNYKQHRKTILKKSFNEKDNFLSMFISSINNTLNELETLELIYFSSIFANCDDWDKVCDLIKSIRCYICKKDGHKAENCKYKNKNKNNEDDEEKPQSNYVAIKEFEDPLENKFLLNYMKWL
ncbi:hypothetical protein H8356DRAFT_1431353 [Neocallimastix lanati (nom. inval.)]|nr:hypothetical protein H8356DRAFT_1431353 [Neocallimastix sp. JGI-2020a]